VEGATTLPRWVLAVLFSALLLAVMGAAGLSLLNRSPAGALPAYGHVPDFTLINQDGQPFNSSDLRGKSAAVGFIYTSCPDICSMLTSRMVALQGELRKAGLLGTDVVLLSVSVDPERDTPGVLKQYAAERGADTAAWTFLTGSPEQVQKVVSEGFRVGLEKAAHASHGASYEVSHSGRVVLVDPQGEVRAYYDGEQLDPARVIADIKKLR